MVASDWLPSLVLLEEYGGDWSRYLEALYNFFKVDFVDNKPRFQGQAIALKRHPVREGKEATFWHFISEGEVEEVRVPEPSRCERIRWPRPIIENSEDAEVKIWKNQRKKETRICLWLEEQNYLVVLAVRKGYILPWTAYPTTRHHTRKKLRKEYERFLRSEKADAAQ